MRLTGRGRRLVALAPVTAAIVLAGLVSSAVPHGTGARAEGPAPSASPASSPVAYPAVSAVPDPGPEPTPVAPGVVRQTLAYAPGGPEHQLDVYAPAGPVQPRPTVLLLHGGSWEIGDKVEWVGEAEQLAARGWTAVAVNYRRTPTAPWPAPLQDARGALGFVQAHAAALGVDPARTGALGDSAGAQLAELLGRPAPGVVPVQAVVSWSGITDLAGLLQQPLSGGCSTDPCAWRGLARKAVGELMRCAPRSCPQAYRQASPAADLVQGAATYATVSAHELIDPRQAWAMDAALSRAHVLSRVRVLPGEVHGRGYQALVWQDSVDFLASVIAPGTAPALAPEHVSVTLLANAGRLSGQVLPAETGSTVALQHLAADGWSTRRWATVGVDGRFTARVPYGAWRAVWTGSGTRAVSAVAHP